MSTTEVLTLREKVTPTGTTIEGDDEPQAATVITFPDGGLKAWLTIAGGAIVLFSNLGAVQSFGVFEDYYTRFSLNQHTPSQISWIGSVQAFLLFAMGLFAGKLFDDGYFYHLMASGGILYVLCFFMLSLTQPGQYWQIFLAQGIGMGLAMGITFTPALSISAHYFRKKRALANGIVFAGSSIGGLIYPIMLNRLFPRIGFPWAIRAVAFMILGLLCIAFLIMKTRLPPRRLQANAVKAKMRHILTDWGYWTTVAGSFLIFLGLYFPIFYLQLFAVTHGVDNNLAFYSIAITNAASSLGRIIPSFFADSYGLFNVAIPMVCLCAISIFAMIVAGSRNGVIAIAIIYGFFSGGFLGLTVPLTACHARSIEEVGTRVGISMFIVGFALLVGSPISGALLNAPRYTWSHPIIFSGITLLLGTVLLIVSRSIVARRKGTWRV